MDVESYAVNYLVQWERLATVRGRPRARIAGDLEVEHLLPAMMVPLVDHPAVTARGPELRRWIFIQSCHRLMAELALLETDVNGPLSIAVANRPHKVELLGATRQVAYTVAVDEVYHAFIARGFIEDLARVTGVEPVHLQGRCQLERSLLAARAVAVPELLADLDLVILCIAENSFTDELVSWMKVTDGDSPLHAAMVEHMVDEGRHAVFFQRLLADAWSRLDPEAQNGVAAALLPFLREYLLDTGSQREHDVAMLKGFGIPAEEAAEIADQSRPPMTPSEDPMTHNILGVLEKAGVLAHSGLAEGLRGMGCISEEASS